MPLENRPDTRARRYQPTCSLPPERPQVALQPCAACGADVDPLRAPCVIAFEDGVRLLCGEECKKDHRSGERARRRLAPLVAADLDGAVPAMRGGALDSAAPAMRGGALDSAAPAMRGGALDAAAPAMRGGALDAAAPAMRRGALDAAAPAMRRGALDAAAPAMRRGALDAAAPAMRRGALDAAAPAMRRGALDAAAPALRGGALDAAAPALRGGAAAGRSSRSSRSSRAAVAGSGRRSRFPGLAASSAAAGEGDSAERGTTVWLWLGTATIGTAITLACFPGLETAFACVLLISLAALASLRLSTHNIPEIGALGWLLGPLGAVVAAVAAYPIPFGGDGRLALFSAIVAAAAILVRTLLDAQSRRPVDQTLQNLLRALPERVQLPARTLEPDESDTGELVETARIRVGEEFVVRHGQRVGLDGNVVLGEASLLPHPGATSTVRRVPGDAVLAGAEVVEGALRVQATRVGDDRTLVRVARCGQVGLRDTAPFLRATQLLTRWSALLILLASAGLVLFARLEGMPLPLAAASAILLAAPLLAVRRAAEWSLLGAATTAGARGILFQSGATLDLAGQIRTVAMAPHRTLTEGKPEVVDVFTLGDNVGSELFGLVAGAELAAGDHPIGRALAAYASKRNIPQVEARRAIAVPGRGLTATGPHGEEIVIGSRRLLLDQGVSVAVADAYAARAEAAGRTAVFVSVSGRVRAVFTLQDHLRTGARAAVQRLFDMGLEVVLLTGDQRGPIEQLAAGFDIAHIKCELLPDERADEVRSLRDAGGPVAVIGYPSEDVAALAAADVAIALGAAGGAGGDNSIALVSEDLRDAATALWIARAARSRALGSLRVATITFLGVSSAAVAGWIEPGMAALIALLVDVHGIQAGTRLLRRIALRMPHS